MKILHVTSDWKWTGPAEPMLHAVRGLRERGHEVDAVFPPAPGSSGGGIETHARERGIEPALLLARGQGLRPLRDRPDVARLRALLAERLYDIVHVHHARDHLLCLRAGARRRARLVASWHHGEAIPDRPWTRWLLGPRGAAGVSVLSQNLAEQARATLGGAPARVGVVAGCVDTQRFAPRERDPQLRAALGLEPASRVIGLVARLQPHRRVDLLLEAFRLALPDAPGLKLLVLGRGTHQHEVLTEPVKQMGLGPSVIHAGYRGDDYLDVIAQLDALVFLVPGSDGSCRAVLEAMSLEIPVIASRRGVLPETVSDGETGSLVDEQAPELAARFSELWREPARWQARGKAARRDVLERHTIARQAEALERLYEAG